MQYTAFITRDYPTYLGGDLAAPEALAAVKKLCPYYQYAGMDGVFLPITVYTPKDELPKPMVDALVSSGLNQPVVSSNSGAEILGAPDRKPARDHYQKMLPSLTSTWPGKHVFVFMPEVDLAWGCWLLDPKNHALQVRPGVRPKQHLLGGKRQGHHQLYAFTRSP